MCSPISADRSTESRRESNSLGQTNYNKLNKRKCCVEAGQDERNRVGERLTKKGQSIYTLPHMYANRKVWDTQKPERNLRPNSNFFHIPFCGVLPTQTPVQPDFLTSVRNLCQDKMSTDSGCIFEEACSNQRNEFNRQVDSKVSRKPALTRIKVIGQMNCFFFLPQKNSILSSGPREWLPPGLNQD